MISFMEKGLAGQPSHYGRLLLNTYRWLAAPSQTMTPPARTHGVAPNPIRTRPIPPTVSPRYPNRRDQRTRPPSCRRAQSVGAPVTPAATVGAGFAASIPHDLLPVGTVAPVVEHRDLLMAPRVE